MVLSLLLNVLVEFILVFFLKTVIAVTIGLKAVFKYSQIK